MFIVPNNRSPLSPMTRVWGLFQALTVLNAYGLRYVTYITVLMDRVICVSKMNTSGRPSQTNIQIVPRALTKSKKSIDQYQYQYPHFGIGNTNTNSYQWNPLINANTNSMFTWKILAITMPIGYISIYWSIVILPIHSEMDWQYQYQ